MATIRRRILFVLSVLCLVLLTIAGRFFYYQIVEGPDLARKANIMRTRGFSFPESGRGGILDRYCQPLTDTGLAWACFAMPGQIMDFRQTSIRIAKILETEPRLIEENLREAARRREPYVLLKTPISDQKTRQELASIDGILVAEVQRRYREDGRFVHLLGNLGPPGTGEEVRVVGKAGLEIRYEDDLRARSNPKQLVTVVDGLGNPIPGISPKMMATTTETRDVVTTIDRRMQLMTETIVDQHIDTGAVVILDVANRDILTMVSRPTYNPYDPGSYTGSENTGCQLNRALAAFHPGSLFKIAVTAAALENNLLTADETFYCPGYHEFSEGLVIPCWKPSGHGNIITSQALAESCNAAFIEIGLRLGRTRLLNFCDKASLFSREIIGYENAQGDSRLDIDYGRPALGNASLGQKGIMMTPLQVANLVATVADNGVYKRPRLVREVREGDQIIRILDPDQGEQVMSAGTSETLRGFLGLVTTTGTGRNADLPGIGCGGKTATSQTGQYAGSGDEILDTWFVGYFPAEKPRWVIAVLVEHGQSGGRNAAPVFREIAERITEMYLP